MINHASPVTAVVKLATTVLAPSRMVTVAIWPSSTPTVVPVTANPAATSLALIVLSPVIEAVIAIVGAVRSMIRLWVAWGAWLPATSDTFAWTV